MAKKTSGDTPKAGLPIGWTRATFIIKEEYLKKLKNLAYWKRLTIKEVIDEALRAYLENKIIKKLPK